VPEVWAAIFAKLFKVKTMRPMYARKNTSRDGDQMKLCGIDPGRNGAFAIISQDGLIVEPMPTLPQGIDLNLVREWLAANNPDIVYLEEVHAIFKASASSTFSFGRYFGALEGMLHGLKIPYILVQPKVWQKLVHEGIHAKKDMKAKDRSRLAASRLFPGMKMSEGEMDAALIALYGWRTYERGTSN
jgi:crossover junction endodeoxyribonuclease RuvC